MATVTVRINGMEYNLKGKEDEAYLKNIADYVEVKLQEILEKNNKLSVSAASVLTAINLADEAFKGNKEYNELFSNYENLQIANKSLKDELKNVKDENIFNLDKQEKEYELYIDSLRKELELTVNAKDIVEEEKKVIEEEKKVIEEEKKSLSEIKISLEESLRIEKEKFENHSSQVRINELLAEVNNLKEQLSLMEEKNKKLILENKTAKEENKELKFNVQSCKYKIIDLEKKFLDSQITVAKEKAKANPLIKLKK